MLGLLLALALPGTAFADQRGRRRDRDDDRHDRRDRRRDRADDKRDRKCGKFVNCHDARDGRWDGKGPQRDRDRRFQRRNRSNDRWDGARWRDRNDRRLRVRDVDRTNITRFPRIRG